MGMGSFLLSLFACAVVSAQTTCAFAVRDRASTPSFALSLQYKSTAASTFESERGDENWWSLETDWILEDAVPRYTVTASGGEDDGRRRRATFWGQLKDATSAFENVSEQLLEERFRELHRADAHLHCGPAPPTLVDWWVDDAKRLMGGKDAANGASVWFYVQGGGRVLGDGSPTPRELRYAPGAWVEAKDGGPIYELGPAAAAPVAATAPASLASPARQNRNFKMLEEFYGRGPDRAAAEGAPFLRARQLILVAIVGSSVLSASLAFGIGQGIGRQVPSSLPPEAVTMNVRVMSSSCTRDTASSTSASAPRPEPSIQERRARQELRLIREKKTQQYLEDAIQRDEAKLWDLQREETRQEGAALGF